MVTRKEIMKSRCYRVNSKTKQRIWDIKSGEVIKIRTIDNKPIWHLMKEYINSLKKEQLFTRKDLLKAIYGDAVANAIRRVGSTVDGYRNCITVVNCIEIIEYGKYKKLKDIPVDLTISKLQKHVSSDNWKTWFMPIEDI